MLEGLFRDTYQKTVIEPLLKFPAIQKLKPLTVTYTACLVGVCFLPFLYMGWKWAAITALVLSGFLDTLDGSLARLQNASSPKGAVWDIVCDRTVEFSIILGLFLQVPEQRALLSLNMLGSILLCITSFLVVGIFTGNEGNSGKSFHYSPGIMERAEAFIFFIAMVLLPDAFVPLSSLFISLVLLTTLIRLVQFSIKH